ncbi:uncharacterized protein LOC112568675 isoform X10 [Pomacea canaliculata]|uniref:uncharacterized protein LOC112568675 isoform X10 n=1 Tax=Pomacea canaliculata TaxID=400727 RepID=UPI000D73173B|nr:uncharacterized protein LOC112568675 isoform X10 [Pomacea canaliculata]
MTLRTQEQVLLILSAFALFDVGLHLKCSQKINTREWSLYLVCWDKTKGSSDKCQWDVVNMTTHVRVEAPQTSPSPDTFFNCSGKFSLPLSTGEYIYHLLLPTETWHNAFNLRIDDPGKLTMKNCKHEVSEGNNVTCVCSTQRKGNPRPVIYWVGQNTSSTLHLYEVTGEDNKTYTCEMIWGNQTKTVSYRFLVRGSRGGNAQNETANGNEGERTSKKSDSSTSSPGQAAGNGSKSGGSTPRSSSSGSDKPSTNPNYTSTALQEVEIHPYMDLHTRDPTYASTTSSKDPHMYMELKTLKALQPGSEKNGNDGYETPQVPGQANKSSDGYETPQPPREGRRRSATYANQGVPADPIQEEVNYYNEA